MDASKVAVSNVSDDKLNVFRHSLNNTSFIKMRIKHILERNKGRSHRFGSYKTWCGTVTA